jgi:S1-C subfamily serine protease
MYPVRSGVLALSLLLAAGVVVQAQPGGEPANPRSYLGVLVGPAEEGGTGIVVREVTPDSSAAKAGLKAGDRIVKLNEGEVRDPAKFSSAVATRKPGEKLRLGILRDGKEQTLTVTLGERPAGNASPVPGFPAPRQPAFLGVQTQPLTPELKSRLHVEADGGAVVTEVVPNSPASQAGLKPDDVITAVDDHPVKTPIELRDAVQKAGPGKKVTLQVLRGKEKLSLGATLREGAIGFFLTPGEDRFPTVDVESMLEQGRRIRELERRVDELEKRLREREKK